MSNSEISPKKEKTDLENCDSAKSASFGESFSDPVIDSNQPVKPPVIKKKIITLKSKADLRVSLRNKKPKGFMAGPDRLTSSNTGGITVTPNTGNIPKLPVGIANTEASKTDNLLTNRGEINEETTVLALPNREENPHLQVPGFSSQRGHFRKNRKSTSIKSLPTVNHLTDPAAVDTKKPVLNAKSTPSSAPKKKIASNKNKKRWDSWFRSGWIPNEHGAYAMVTIPYWIGAGIAGFRPYHILLFLTWFIGYFAFFATTLWLKSGRKDRYFRPVQVYGSITGILGAITVGFQVPLLEWAIVFIPLVIMSTWLAHRRKERSLLARSLAVVASGAMLLVAFDLGTGFNRNFGFATWFGENQKDTIDIVSPLGTLTGWSWAFMVALCITAYYWSSIFFVKSLVRMRKSTNFRYQSEGVHVFLTALMLTFQFYHLIRLPFALLWVFMTTLAFLAPPFQERFPKIITIKRIGQFELVLSFFLYLFLLI